MNDQNKQKQKEEEASKTILGGKSAAKSSSIWKSLFAKRWVSPAIFMAAAAIIVTLMWIYQSGDQASPTTGEVDPTEVSLGEDIASQGEGQQSIDVTIGSELMIWPVVNKATLQVERPFFDPKASEAEQEAAMVQVGTTFTPNMGIDFVHPDGLKFDVLAALSGKVTRAEQHPTNGYIVEITHDEDLVTVYQSVADLQVALGDDVKQGTKIAVAGRNDIGSDLGIHLHYQTMKDGKAINPNLLVIEKQKK